MQWFPKNRSPSDRLVEDESFAVHLFRLVQSHQIQHGGGDVRQAAVPQAMRLQTIGEYVKKIDDKTNKQLLPKYPQVPWVKVIGQRNIISHEYSAVDEEKIFITIKKHLPPLKSTVLLIIKDIEKDLDSQE